MEFKEFAFKLRKVIGGASNTQKFTKTLFEAMMNDSGPELIKNIKPSTFKSYFNGYTGISNIASIVLANLSDDDEFPAYLEGFGDTTAQLLADEFIEDIPDINAVNTSTKITDLFLEILKDASGKKKSTTKSAKKDEVKTPHDILTEKVLASGQAVADVLGKAISNLADPTTVTTDKLDESKLTSKDIAFLKRFRNQVEPLLTYCMDHDPTGEGTKLSLADEINDFLQSWKYDVRKIQDLCFRKIVIDAMQVLGDYTYYLSDKFLRWIPDTDILWFRNESIEEGNQLRDVLRPETLKKRTEMRNIYVRLYPIPEDTVDTDPIEIPEEIPSTELPFTLEDNQLLQEFTSDYDEIMLILIGDNYSTALIDMTLPCKIKDLFENKWRVKSNDFIDLSLKSNVLALLGELNNISNSFLVSGSMPPFLGSSRTKIRNLYVKLHPDQFAGAFPYDAFIDDWDDGEYY